MITCFKISGSDPNGDLGSEYASLLQPCRFLLMVVQQGSLNFKRGLRQGDPVSLLLFQIVVEGLKGMVSKSIDSGLLDAYEIGNNDVPVSLL